MPKPILLAPAGTRDALVAAVRCGADAVYLGTSNFNARRNADNFDDLRATVRFCHERGAKVYVTVNTLVRDGEMPALEATADEVAAAGADAVIIQDMAVMRLFADRYPSLPRWPPPRRWCTIWTAPNTWRTWAAPPWCWQESCRFRRWRGSARTSPSGRRPSSTAPTA